jgi:amino acid transporter
MQQLEFIFSKPRYLITCMYGIPYIIVGNLSGNSIAIGSFIMEAADRPKSRGPVIGIALTVLTAAVLLHVCSRRGGILVNNVFAVVKVLILVSIIVIGFVKAGGSRLGGPPPAPENFDPDTSFRSEQRGVTDYAKAFMYVLYSYSGFQQPFYVLSEVRKPRQTFPKYTLIALFVGITLFMLANIAYFLVVPKKMQLESPDVAMATLFFGQVFGSETAKQALAGLVALSIFGNIVVMTFTASRVKQEIAKEGILPFSLFFATSRTTPYAWLKARWKPRPTSQTDDIQLEQTPMAALGLHWAMSVTLVGVTAMLPPATSFTVLIELYSYVVRVLVPMAVSGGLLYLKFSRSMDWSSKANFKMPSVHVILYFLTLAFLAVVLFVKPPAASPFTDAAGHVKWFIVPSIGVSALAWGLTWFWGLKLVLWSKGRVLIVTRTPVIVEDEGGQWVQKAELVEHELHTRRRPYFDEEELD